MRYMNRILKQTLLHGGNTHNISTIGNRLHGDSIMCIRLHGGSKLRKNIRQLKETLKRQCLFRHDTTI